MRIKNNNCKYKNNKINGVKILTLSNNYKAELVRANITEEEVKEVVNQYGLKVPYMSAYVIMNMLYSDMKNTLGTGEDEESLKMYLQATNDWYFDKDINSNGEEKLFNYRFYVVKYF